MPLAALSGVVPRWAVIGLFILALGASISATRAFLMPATMAILLFFVFSPLRRRLGRRGVPDWVTASLVSLALVAGIGAIGAFVTGPAEQLINDAPQIIRDVQAKFDALAASFPMLERLGIGGSFGLQDTAVGDAAMAAAPDSTAVMLQVATITPGVLGELLFVLVLLFFMMTSGDLLYLKIVQSFDTMGDKRNAYLALRQIEERLGNYLGAITIINVGLGIMIGVVLWVLGMPAPALFGMMATLLNFIPYLGVLIGAAMATAVALVSMDGFATPLLVGAAYVAICAVEGQFITPFFLSRRLEMNTVVVFLAVALWAWLWSVVGMIVAVPILVVVRVLCEHIPGTEKIANFLGGPDADSVMADGDADTAPPGVSASG